MKKLSLIVLTGIFVACGSKQKTVAYQSPPVPVTDAEKPLSELGRLHRNLITSESFIKSNQLMERFVDKLVPKPGDNKEVQPLLSSEILLLKWINDNLSKTNFKSVDEASELYNQIKEFSIKSRTENEEYYRVWASCSDEKEREKYPPHPVDETLE